MLNLQKVHCKFSLSSLRHRKDKPGSLPSISSRFHVDLCFYKAENLLKINLRLAQTKFMPGVNGSPFLFSVKLLTCYEQAIPYK